MKKFLIFLILLLFYSCDNTSDTDPCEGTTPFRAEIEVFEKISHYSGDTLILSDSVLSGNMIYFKAKKSIFFL